MDLTSRRPGRAVTTGLTAALWLLSMAPATAESESPNPTSRLSLVQAQAAALARPDIVAGQRALRDQAQGLRLSAGRWDSPRLEYTDESVSGDGVKSDERSLWVRQTIDLSGELGRQREAADAEGLALQAAGEQTLAQLRQAVRERYFDTLYWQQRAELLSRWQSRIDALVGVMQEQVDRGESARYDLHRLQQPHLDVMSQKARVQAQHAVSLSALHSLTGTPSSRTELTESLVPPEPAALTALLDDLAQSPELRALAARRDAAHATQRAEQRARFPDSTLGIGHRQADSGGIAQDGVLLSLELPIPVFDRRSGPAQVAAAQAQALESELELLQRERMAAVRGQWQAAVQLRARAIAISEQARAAADALTEAAEAGYAGAELGALELADAFETALTTLLDAQDLTRAAREADIRLHALVSGATDD